MKVISKEAVCIQFFLNNSKSEMRNLIFFSLIAAKILIAGSSLRDSNANDVTQVFDLTDTIKVFTICF